MAAVVASKPLGAQPKIKKPSMPPVQTNGVKNSQQPSPSPSSAAKRLPGQLQSATPVSATPTSANPNAPRPNRRLQRLNTRGAVVDNLTIDKKTAKKYPEPYVPKSSHTLKKFKGKAPSLVVHLHPTHFRFDQQDGSFSYHSEMRIFIEHLQKGTIPHDMVEEFRKSEVQFYDGWLIVRIVDHCATTNSAHTSTNSADDGKPFSIHNYNPHITPSPYAPYPTKEQTGQRSPQMKQDQQNKDSKSNDVRSDEPVAAPTRPGKSQPKVYHVALRPTILSRHMDLVMDAMAPDPKSINRKQSQANVNSRGAGGAPPTPVSGVPSTPATERAPPLKKQKLKIDAKDLLEYEARVINATAPPLYLDAAETLEEAEAVVAMLRDPHHDAAPPSAKSRKRTFAELAADDAHAKEQERFMLIMDERNPGNNAGANPGGVDTQAGAGLFQPRFEKFNALDTIKREFAERKQREKDRQLQEDENRRGLQERQAEEERRRMMQQHQQRQRENQARIRQEQEMAQQAHRAAQQQQAQAQRQQHQQQQAQASSIPPQMQTQMMAPQPRSSPIIRQGTPHAVSSPLVNNPQAGQAMAVSGSQQGAGSPQRPGSAVQHGHPGVPMTRGPSGQGPSRHGTPQIPHSTPGMRTATPVLRQNTPAHMTQASPHGSMMAPTPQMTHAATMQGQMTQQQQYTPAQIAHMQQRHAQMQHAAQVRGQPMVNGTPQMAATQAQMHAQQQRDAVIQRAQQQQAMQQPGNVQNQQMAQSPAQGQNQYKQQLSEQMKAQMSQQAVVHQGQNQGSPAPNHMTPQQSHAAAQLAHQQQAHRIMAQQNQQQSQMMANMGQGMPQQQQQQQQARGSMPPGMQQFFNAQFQGFQQRLMATQAQKYGGNVQMLSQQELANINAMAQKLAGQELQKKRQQTMQQQAMRQQQAGAGMQNGMGIGGGGGGGGGGMQPQQQQQHPNMNVNANPNMQAAFQQQQQAVNMQQMQLQHAQHMMGHLQGGQQQGGVGNGGGGGGGGMAAQQTNMASITAYQQQLQAMQAQQQNRQV